MPAVYMITCNPTGEFYIGASENPAKRWETHIQDWKKKRNAPLLQAAYDAHGLKAFEFDVLVEVPQAILWQTEWRVIYDMQPALNRLGKKDAKRRYDPHARKRRKYLVGDRMMTMREIEDQYPTFVAMRVKKGLRGPAVLRTRYSHR